MGKIKKILENELVGGTQTNDIYPVTSIKAIYNENNERLDNILKNLNDKIGNLVDLTSEQTITAAKTFSGGINMNDSRISKVKEPTESTDAVNKQYVDSQISAEAKARTEADAALQTQINGKQNTLIVGKNITIEDDIISAPDATKLSVKITWSELKALRDNSQLVAGTWYRITDYNCTTIQEGTRSAEHPFDVIVRADSENKLNEEAFAIQHEGDTYFTNSKLSAWRLWYCLDNDTTRFAWADETNGKGVIYRMIDEFNNDIPYDFKNIQFLRKFDSDKGLWSTVPTDNTGVPCYTFSSSGNSATTSFTDMSLLASNRIYSNSIGNYVNNNKQTLNNNCFFGSSCYSNSFGINCYNNSFGKGCDSNILGNNCYSNSFGSNCDGNSFGNNCYSNIFGNNCYSNSFGSRCYLNSFISSCFRNTFGNYCYRNTFGNNCGSNTFENNCVSNTFGNDCSSNTFGNNYQNNTFGNDCSSNTFGNICLFNSFGSNCSSNSFGNDCLFNSFGNNCDGNSFGSRCNNIKFASDSSASTKYHFYQNNHFGDGCYYILFKGTGTASNTQQVQYYNFAQGTRGTGAYLTVNGVRNKYFETKVAQNSAGELKVYCEADLIK